MRRRSLRTLGIFSSLAILSLGGVLTACEDGPNQTYSPSPLGAGNNWNNGNPPPSVGNAGASYDGGFNAITPLNLCTPDQQRIAWAKLLNQPIIPGDPNNGFKPTFGGLNLAGPDWGGITFQEVEQKLCSGIDVGPAGDGTQVSEGACFGDNCEFLFAYVAATHVVNQVVLNLGYTGACDFTSDPKYSKHSYHMVIGQQIQKDNAPWEIDWTDSKLVSLMEIYNGMQYSFGGAASQGGIYNGPNPVPCNVDNSCLVYPPSVAPSNGNECIFGVRQLLTYWQWTCPNSLQPGVSTIAGLYYDWGKVMPYSHEGQNLTIDSVGPTTHPRSASTDPKGCNMFVGLDFGSFIKNCGVGAATTSNIGWQKLTGGHTHDVETVSFNVVGINLGWTDETIETPGNQGVVTDNYLPCPGGPTCASGAVDFATDWDFDVRTFQVSDNDDTSVQNTGGSPYGPFRGTGLVQREWARLVQIDASQNLLITNPQFASVPGFPHTIGDPACRVDPVSAQAIGCTGFEGFAIGGEPEPTDNDSTVTGYGVPGGDSCKKRTYTLGACAGVDPVKGTPLACFGNLCDNLVIAGQGYAANLYGAYYSSALEPGDPTSVFCQDPSQASLLTGKCQGGAMWDQARIAVTSVAGLGNPLSLPWELRDRRYYFRWWGIAMIKYYKAYGQFPTPWGNSGALTALEVANQGIDLESLFFDNNFGDGFDKDEYIDRSVMQATNIGPVPLRTGGTVTVPAKNYLGGPGPAAAAMDFNYGSDVIAANQRYSDWFRRMDREEAGMFQAMLVDKTHLPGSENTVNITNLAGNPILAQNYLSYECATQWPTVTINMPAFGSNPKKVLTGPWTTICAGNCPAASLLNPSPCPFPPGVGVTGDPKAALSMDQNANLAGTGSTGASQVTSNGSPIVPQSRLAAYPSVWGGTGGWCPGSGPTVGGVTDPEGDSYSQQPSGKGVNNPYEGGCVALSTGIPVIQNTHGSVFKAAANPDENNARIKVTSTNSELLTAFVNIPNMPNPFNSNTDTKINSGAAPLSDTKDVINVTVPWTKSVDGVGFSIPLTGTTAKFVQTAQLDFSGVLETYLIDYVDHIPKGSTTTDGTIDIQAIEGDDFLGEVFLCQDVGGTAQATQDLLGVHMYDTGGAILDWLVAHPGVQDTCNVVVQYSQYDNFLDVIASLSAGVVVYINQGSGYGRVVGVQVFDPVIAQIP
jgi:hypothetical protein